jgi:hypothetical protein
MVFLNNFNLIQGERVDWLLLHQKAKLVQVESLPLLVPS